MIYWLEYRLRRNYTILLPSRKWIWKSSGRRIRNFLILIESEMLKEDKGIRLMWNDECVYDISIILNVNLL